MTTLAHRPLQRHPERDDYVAACRQQWANPALSNAIGNWQHWRRHHDTLVLAMRLYRDGSMGNSLKQHLWKLQLQLQPDRSRLDPLLDFCNHHQSVHLRRGLVIYCTAILDLIEEEERPS